MTINEQEYREMYRVMRRIRAFENAAAELWEEGEIHGELHLANGHEAVAAGIILTDISSYADSAG